MRVAGIGCRPGTGPGPILKAIAAAGRIDMLATIPAREPELRSVAATLSLPLRLVAVAGVATPTQSSRIQALHGTGSVAEAAAIACGGRLLAPRRTFGPVTIAIAIAEVP